MSDPSRATIQTEWANAVKLLDECRKFGHVNAQNALGLMDTLQQSYQGDYLDDAEAAVEAIRNNINNCVEPGIAAAVQRPFLRQYCKSVIGRTDLTSDEQMWDEMYKYFIDNVLRVQSRVFTFGTPAAGTNTGTTQIIRLTKDRYNFDLEAQHIDSKRALCVRDHNTNLSKGQEIWQFVGQARGRDDIKRSGSGQEAFVQGMTADDSLLLNASWNSFDSASAPTSITNWTFSTSTIGSGVATLDSTNYFRAAPSEGTTPYALSLVATQTITQKISVGGRKLDPNVPYILAVAWNRSIGSASGTLVFRMGSIATTVTVSAQSGWTITTVPNPIGQSAWYRLFAQDDLQVQIDWTRTGGTLLIDDVMLIPGTFFNGSWYWVIPSSATYVAPRVLDSFTWADIATDSIMQRWFWRAFNRHLPHSNGSSITWSEP